MASTDSTWTSRDRRSLRTTGRSSTCWRSELKKHGSLLTAALSKGYGGDRVPEKTLNISIFSM